MDALVSRLGLYNQRAKVYLGVLLLSIHSYLLIYINSPFLSEHLGFSDTKISALYIAGSALTLLILAYLPNILAHIGNLRLSLLSIGVAIISVLGIASGNPHLASIFFILYIAAIPAIYLSFDIFLESVSPDESETGGVRTLFITIANITLILSPFLASKLMGDGIPNYPLVYISASVVLLPLFILIISSYRHMPKEDIRTTKIHAVLSSFLKDRNLFNVYIANFILKMFYAMMVIYVPLYLHQNIGFSLQTITSIIFPIMLLPFIFVEIPVGKIADKWLGEKEMMIIGFLIAGASTIYMAFLTSTDPFVWAFVLFATRVGASMIEATSESYFFKHVDSSQSDFITFYRTNNPIAYIIVPLMVGVLLPIIGYQSIFVMTGILLFVGIDFATKLVDTK